jgi:two-component system response regulator
VDIPGKCFNRQRPSARATGQRVLRFLFFRGGKFQSNRASQGDRSPKPSPNVTYNLWISVILSIVNKPTEFLEGPGLSLEAPTLFGAQVKAQRCKLGLTQEELAWRAGMHCTHLANVERAGGNLTLRSIANLALALEVTPSLLLSQKVPGPPGDNPVMEKREILMVEDSKADAELALIAFRRANLDNPIKVVESGGEALLYLRCEGRYAKRQLTLPELILLDLNLPDMTGEEVLRELNAQPKLCLLPVVILTSSHSDRSMAECMKLGARDYIVKPLDFEGLSKITGKADLHWTLATNRHPAKLPRT